MRMAFDATEKEELAALSARLDEVRAISYSLADKVGASLQRLEAGLSELSALASELKGFKAEPHRQSIVSEVTESVGNLFSKHPRAEEVAVLFGKEVSKELDAKLARLAELEAELLRKSDAAITAGDETKKQVSALQEWAKDHDRRVMQLADSVVELKTSIAFSKQQVEGAAGKISSLGSELKNSVSSMGSELRNSVSMGVGEIRGVVGEALDAKLSKLAELEAELYKKENENSVSLASIRDNMGKFELSQNREEVMVNALGNMSAELSALKASLNQQVTVRQEENYAALRVSLLKIVENQNHVNGVLADSLAALLDATEASKNTIAEIKLHVTDIKSKVDLESGDALEKRVAERLAKKLTGA